jgi:hypothetical protein
MHPHPPHDESIKPIESPSLVGQLLNHIFHHYHHQIAHQLKQGVNIAMLHQLHELLEDHHLSVGMQWSIYHLFGSVDPPTIQQSSHMVHRLISNRPQNAK